MNRRKPTKANETFVYLISEMVDYVVDSEKVLKREIGSGDVYEQVEGSCNIYKKYMNTQDFLNSIFKGDPIFHSRVGNMGSVIKYMKTYDHEEFGLIEFDKGLIGFLDGVLNPKTDEFTPYPENIISKRHIQAPFTTYLDIKGKLHTRKGKVNGGMYIYP